MGRSLTMANWVQQCKRQLLAIQNMADYNLWLMCSSSQNPTKSCISINSKCWKSREWCWVDGYECWWAKSHNRWQLESFQETTASILQYCCQTCCGGEKKRSVKVDSGDGKEPNVKHPCTSAACDKSIMGISSSNVASHKLNAQVDTGAFVPNGKRLSWFKTKIQSLDPHAQFSDSDIHLVRHSKYGEYKKMKEPYNIEFFSKHVNFCKGPKLSVKFSGGGMPDLWSGGFVPETNELQWPSMSCMQWYTISSSIKTVLRCYKKSALPFGKWCRWTYTSSSAWKFFWSTPRGMNTESY